MRVLVAPDKFKFALDASAAADAIAAGVREARPDADIVLCPLADGGEGTGRVLAAAAQAHQEAASVLDPRGQPRLARWWRTEAGCAIIEMAEASGLALLEASERNPLLTTSYGTGQLLAGAANAECLRVQLCVGGSATVDGGAGCLQALGWEMLDTYGRVIDSPMTGGLLGHVRELLPPATTTELHVAILCDVDNRLLGPRGAAAVFGPQKGATPDQVAELERGLTHWADLLRDATRRDPRDVPGSGAAGGLPAGLYAACRARLVRGFSLVAREVGLEAKMAGTNVCLTGEGRIDAQTLAGKVVAGVAELAARHSVPTVAFAGAVVPLPGQSQEGLAAQLGLRRIVTLSPPGEALEQSLQQTATRLRAAAAALVADAAAGPGGP